MSSVSDLPPPPPGSDSTLYRWLYLIYQFVIGLSGSTPSGVFGPPGITTPDEAMVPNSSRSFDYLNITELSLGGASVTSTANEVNQLHFSGIQRSTLADLQSSATGFHTATFMIGDEAANIINVSIQILNVDGNPSLVPTSFVAYLSDDPSGLGFTAAAPSGGTAIGSDGFLATLVTGKIFQLITNSLGVLDLNITEAGVATWYLCLVGPYGKLKVSDAITFA